MEGAWNSVREYILFLPIFFIIHDMEEIIGFNSFFQKNPWIFDKYPIITAPYKNLKTECFALAVYEEFIPFFGLSLLAYFFSNKVLYALWMGLFLALTGHFVIHIAQSIIIRRYIPSLITSIICLPVSIVIIIKCFQLIEIDFMFLGWVVAAILFMIVNLKFAHKLMHWAMHEPKKK